MLKQLRSLRILSLGCLFVMVWLLATCAVGQAPAFDPLKLQGGLPNSGTETVIRALNAQNAALRDEINRMRDPTTAWRNLTPRQTTARLQALLDSGACELPDGLFVIDATLREPNKKSPVRTIGTGAGQYDPSTPTGSVLSTKRGTYLRWAGPDGGTMYEVTTPRSHLADITLDGAGKAAVGIQWTWPGKGTSAPSGTTLERVYVQNCTEVAFRVGHKASDPLGDTIDFENCTVRNCPIGLLVKNTQAMDHTFRGHTCMEYVPRCFVYEAGGGLHLEGYLFAMGRPGGGTSPRETTVLTLLAPDLARKPGRYNGDFRIGYCKSDAQNYGGFRLLDMQPGVAWNGVRVIAIGGRIAGETKTIQFANVGKGAELSLSGWTNVRRDQIDVAEGGRLHAERVYGSHYSDVWSEDWSKAE